MADPAHIIFFKEIFYQRISVVILIQLLDSSRLFICYSTKNSLLPQNIDTQMMTYVFLE